MSPRSAESPARRIVMNGSISFHQTIDRQIRPYQNFTGGIWAFGKKVTILERSIKYQFFPHFHPYVVNLIQNLNNGGIAELQESDTVYLPNNPTNPNTHQVLTIQPNTTRGIALAPVQATRNNGSTIS